MTLPKRVGYVVRRQLPSTPATPQSVPASPSHRGPATLELPPTNSQVNDLLREAISKLSIVDLNSLSPKQTQLKRELMSHNLFSNLVNAISTTRAMICDPGRKETPIDVPTANDRVGNLLVYYIRAQQVNRGEIEQMGLAIEQLSSQILRDVRTELSVIAPLRRSIGKPSLKRDRELVNFADVPSAQLQCAVTAAEAEDLDDKRRRSLGKRATEILSNWFFAHVADPYPSEEEKAKLCQECGMTVNQVNNWFGNKRMRYKRRVLNPLRDVPEPQVEDLAEMPSLWKSKSGRHTGEGANVHIPPTPVALIRRESKPDTPTLMDAEHANKGL
eukprot:TRINITY_DN12715_c0_g1_i1.p1 TRINITY_DN12715_c0_g1~~TRINITY_DN12715_c0_g1_i1.p1  ORF type:complete len:330 (+),score=35.96 TRINITY_DN12715_c0_g1_i1:2-991(+)